MKKRERGEVIFSNSIPTLLEIQVAIVLKEGGKK